MNSEKETGRKRKRFNAVDAFLLLAAAAILLSLFLRGFLEELTGPDFGAEAAVTFQIESARREAASALKEGDTLRFEEDGAVFGILQELHVSETGETQSSAKGEFLVQGADTEAGFRTKEGHFISPFESYVLTNGTATVQVVVMGVQILAKE